MIRLDALVLLWVNEAKAWGTSLNKTLVVNYITRDLKNAGPGGWRKHQLFKIFVMVKVAKGVCCVVVYVWLPVFSM